MAAETETKSRRKRFRWWMIPAGLAGLIVIVIAVGVIILLTKDVTEYRDILTAELRKQTGRKVEIKGAFDLSVSFAPSIVAEDLSIANAPWGSRAEMLTAKRLEVKIALFPLIGGTVEAKRLVLDGADLLLETDKEGTSNWPLASTEKDRGESELLAADSLEIKDSLITLIDGRSTKVRTLKIDQATGGLDPALNALVIEATGLINQLPLAATLSIGRKGPKAPLKLALKAGDATLDLDGTVDKPAEMEGLDVLARLDVPTLTTLGALTGSGDLPKAVGPVAFEGHIKGGGARYAVDAIVASFGPSKLTGALTLDLENEIPRLKGKLAASTIDLDLILGDDKKAKKPRGGRLFDDEPIELDWLAALDVELELSAARASYRGTTLTDLATTITARDKVATLSPLAFKTAGGAMTGEASLDGTGKTPKLALKGKMRGADLGTVLTLLGVEQSGQGKVDIDADLKSTGGSARMLAGGLGGRLDIAMGRGRLDNALIELIAVDLVQQLMPWNVGKAHATINCMVARFPIDRGVMRAERLLLDTTEMTMGGEGSINLGRETLSLRLVPKPKDPALFSLAVPILVEGPLQNPNAEPDSEAVALGVAGSALGTLINPLGILIPFVSAGSGDENPCVAALKKGGQGGKGSASKGKSKGPVEDVVEGVGKGLESVGKGIGSIFE